MCIVSIQYSTLFCIYFTDATTTQSSTQTPTEPPTTEHIKTFEEIKEDLVSFGEKIKRKRDLEKKTSVYDSRPSATSVGVVAIVILSSILGGVVLLDIGTIGAHCKYMKNPNVGRKKNMRKSKKNGNTNFNDVIEMCKLEDEEIGSKNKRKHNKNTMKNGNTNFDNVADMCNIEDETNVNNTIEENSQETNNNGEDEVGAKDMSPEPEGKDGKENPETKDDLEIDKDKDGNEITKTKVDLEIGNNCVSLTDVRMDPNIKENELFTHLQ